MARKLFATRITHARFVVGYFTSDQMATLGGILNDSIKARIQSGRNVEDQPSKALSAKYAKRKAAKGKDPIRDWDMTGNTLRSMVVISANENRCVLSFNNPVAGRIAHWNQLRERAFGVSGRDKQTLVAAVHATVRQVSLVTVRKAA